MNDPDFRYDIACRLAARQIRGSYNTSLAWLLWTILCSFCTCIHKFTASGLVIGFLQQSKPSCVQLLVMTFFLRYQRYCAWSLQLAEIMLTLYSYLLLSPDFVCRSAMHAAPFATTEGTEAGFFEMCQVRNPRHHRPPPPPPIRILLGQFPTLSHQSRPSAQEFIR